MTTLGNYYHDFPRLAKQSGYFFQLYRGRVNWKELESLDIEEIVENRNFQLLEQNLLNVVNCNLEREYDLKILDQKFVKLFKLAQLGVDYLSYCELYLDRCVVLLQEQIISLQEECDLLKEENLKKGEEIKKYKKKSKTLNYQCEKCEKVFVSDVYLKFHDKRRHSNPPTPKSLDETPNKGVNSFQQTENEEKLTIGTQTLDLDKEATRESKVEEIINIKKEDNKKIENMEKELENLKTRLNKAESTLSMKNDICLPNTSPSFNLQSPVFYPSVVPLVSSYFHQPLGTFCDVNSGCQMTVPDFHRSTEIHLADKTNAELNPIKLLIDNSSQVETEKNKSKINVIKEINKNQEIVFQNIKIHEQSVKTDGDTLENQTLKIQKPSECNKENIDPEVSVEDVPLKPLPLPRRTKKLFLTDSTEENKTILKTLSATDSTTFAESNFTLISEQPMTFSSTPIKKVKKKIFSKEVNNLTNERETDSKESLNTEETIPVGHKSKSFFKKFVSRKSPKLSEFSKNWRKSLTNLYDSVSLSGKNSGKSSGSECQNSKAETVNGLNSKLRELGIDPEWVGIPKKTMKQKLKALKHKRKLLAKENSMYPVIRQNLEKTILKKLRQNSAKPEINEKDFFAEKTNEQESTETHKTLNMSISNENLEKPNKSKSIMYDVESESESEISFVETPKTSKKSPESIQTKSLASVKNTSDSESGDKAEITAIEKEFDFSVFQVGKEKPNVDKVRLQDIIVDELETDSDLDEDFLDFDSHSLKTATDYLISKNKLSEKKNFFDDLEEDKLEILLKENNKQFIQKNSESGQSKPQLSTKKKVFFGNHLTDENEDLLSLKSSYGTEES